MFTCNACGIKHCHDKSKRDHTVRELSVSDQYINQMDWEPDCHCGLHELLVDVKAGDVTLPEDELSKLEDSINHFPIPKSEREAIYGKLDGDSVELTGF